MSDIFSKSSGIAVTESEKIIKVDLSLALLAFVDDKVSTECIETRVCRKVGTTRQHDGFFPVGH